MKNEDAATPAQRRTMPLWPDAGRALGLKKSSTYEAAKRGEIPVITIGRRKLVPIAAFERMLNGDKAA